MHSGGAAFAPPPPGPPPPPPQTPPPPTRDARHRATPGAVRRWSAEDHESEKGGRLGSKSAYKAEVAGPSQTPRQVARSPSRQAKAKLNQPGNQGLKVGRPRLDI